MPEITSTALETKTTTATATATATASAASGLASRTRALAYLVDRLSGMRTPIKGSLMIIGRDTGLVMDGISRKHCLLRYEEGEFHVADMESRYGTYVNNVKLTAKEWRPLSPHDELLLGNAAFSLELPARVTRETSHLKAVSESDAAAKPAKDKEPKCAEIGELASLHERARATVVNMILGIFIAVGLALMIPIKSIWFSTCASLFVSALTTYLPMFHWGQSLGKRYVGLRVVMADGSPLTLPTILFREILMKAGSLILFISGLAILNTFNQIFLITLAILLPVLFAIKTRLDGMPYWDQICGTRVIEDAGEAS